MKQNVYDISDKARHYASHSYGHYKSEVYPLFVNLLSILEDGAVVCDIGGGPGHLPYEFFREFPDRAIDYYILDGSRELLNIAEEKLAGNERVHTDLIDFNSDDWHLALPLANAIVSNNALFHLPPDRISDFHANMADRLKPGGFFLNQQSMRYPGGYHPYGENAITRFFARMPYAVMPQMPQYSEEEFRRMKEADAVVSERHGKEIAAAKEQQEFNPTIYHFHTIEEHLQALRSAGLAATTIWQKKEFYVILGIRE